jgi:hypothetical protein
VSDPGGRAAVVRAVRRDLARLLRGLQATGRSLASWPDDALTRLAHADSTTARHLADPGASDPAAVDAAIAAMRALERWVLDGLTAKERAQVHTHALTVRLREDALLGPLVGPDWAVDVHDDAPAVHLSLRAGLESLSDAELLVVCRRLGVRATELDPGIAAEEGIDPGFARRRAERDVVGTLRDGHLLGILLATLGPDVHELLAALIRGRIDAMAIEELVRREAGPDASPDPGERARRPRPHSPLAALRACGLAFVGRGPQQPRVWVPVELSRRLDGVLRAFGV